MAAKEIKEPTQDVSTILRMIGWQVAAGVLFVAFGLEIAFSNIVLHALQPFEGGKAALHALGMESLAMQGFSATVLLIVGSINLGAAAYKFGRVLNIISEK